MNRRGFVMRLLLIACPFIAAVLTLSPETAHAQYLQDRLVPPQQTPLPAVPMVTAPVEPRVFGAEKARVHLWALPFGSFPGSPTLLSTEKKPVNWYRPALDVPAIASEADPLRPAFPLQPTSPKAYASSAKPTDMAPLARFPLSSESLPLPVDDPSFRPAFDTLTVAVPLANPNPAPLLRLAIPDPFEQIRIIRPTNPPADSDDPSTSQDRPPLQKLPQVEPPK
jgi:hypothetical protein